MQNFAPSVFPFAPSGIYDVGVDATARGFNRLIDQANHLAGWRYRLMASQTWDTRIDNLQGDVDQQIPDGPPTPYTGGNTYVYEMIIHPTDHATHLWVGYDYQASNAGTVHNEEMTVSLVEFSSMNVIDYGYTLSDLLGTLVTASEKSSVHPHDRWYPIISDNSGTDRPSLPATVTPDLTPRQLVVPSGKGNQALILRFTCKDVRLLNAFVWEQPSADGVF